jgi:hypothetical protein
MARRSKTTWEQNLPLRLRFERGAAAAYPGLTGRAIGRRKNARIAYGCTVPLVEGYESRRIEFCFSRTTRRPEAPVIYADGPEDSPHRFMPSGKDPRRPLCVWYHGDEPDQRWLPEDGLVSLIELVRIHLFKEAYWREKAVWLGEEVPHQNGGRKQC